MTTPAIGIMGGTFDPVHCGHLRSALEVCRALDLAQVRLVPCALPPHRIEPQASVAERRLMLELAIKYVSLFDIDDREMHREGPSYSIDTLISLRQDYPDNPLFLIVGSDAFNGLKSWSRWEQLLDHAHIVVMQRPGENMQLTTEMQQWLEAHQGEANNIQQPAGYIWPVPVTALSVSSTAIREELAVGQAPRFLVPDAVISLIEQLGLYRRE